MAISDPTNTTNFDIDRPRFTQAMRVLSSYRLRLFPVALAIRKGNEAGMSPDDGCTKFPPYISLCGIDNALVLENIRHWYGPHRVDQGRGAQSQLLPLKTLSNYDSISPTGWNLYARVSVRRSPQK